MDEKYLVNLRHLIDLNKITVYIDIGSCFEYSHPTEGMNILCSLLKYVEQNLDDFPFKDINKIVFKGFIKKIEHSKDCLYELDNYIKSASSKLKIDKGWTEHDAAKVGLPKDSFNITLEELIVFYYVLEKLQDSYQNIKENFIMLWNFTTYFKNIENIKTRLEKRLMYAVVRSRY